MAFNPSEAVDISEVQQNRLWVLYGRSNTGKDTIAATFPKPLFYVPIGDDGRNSIKVVKGIRTLLEPVTSIKQLKEIAQWAAKDRKYKTIVVSTFSMIVSEWKDEKSVKTRKRMTQQMWGDLGTDAEEIIRLFARAAKTHEVVLICHEILDEQINDMEDEIAPNIRPNMNKATRVYLEGVANMGIHCAKLKKEVEGDDGTEFVVRYGCHIGPNPYYWTKVQTDKAARIPKVMVNPTYAKFMKVLGEQSE